jgi:hypothetical protein
MSLHKNRVQMTVTSVDGVTGELTLGSATTGYQSFSSAYGADATVDILITEGNNWEVDRNCAYDHTNGLVDRGTFEASSSGSAVSFTSAAIVSVIATAETGNLWTRTSELSGFSAYGDGTNTQNMTTGTGTTDVTGSTGALRTVDYNVGGYFDTTSAIFLPTLDGLWLIGATAVIGNIVDAAFMAVYISHSTDGTNWSDAGANAGLAWRGAASANQSIGGSGSVLVAANGSTDRWRLRVFHNSTGTPTLPSTAANRTWVRFWAKYMGLST